MTMRKVTDCTLLLVDDDEANLDLLDALLRPEGYDKLLRANDARAVLPLLEEATPDLILLDLHMPHMSGYELLDAIRARTPATEYLPVLVLTADASSEAKVRALSGGAHDFLMKPLDAVEVCLRVKNLLATRLLHRQARLAAVARDRVLSIVAHDLRNPLTAIAANAEMLGQLLSPDAPSDQERRITQIRNAAERMDALVEDLLDIARLEQGMLALRTEVIDVEEFFQRLDSAMQPIAQAAGVRPSFEGNAANTTVHGDSARLMQAFSNLLGNAIKHSPPGGRVRVSWRTDESVIVVNVSDEGAGVPAEQAARVFDAFWQGENGDRRGVGLGLATARAIVEAHGGRMWLDPAAAGGASFSVALPLGHKARTSGIGLEFANGGR